MASVEQYLTVLAGAQSAQNAEAQRAAAQMQIELKSGCPRNAVAVSVSLVAREKPLEARHFGYGVLTHVVSKRWREFSDDEKTQLAKMCYEKLGEISSVENSNAAGSDDGTPRVPSSEPFVLKSKVASLMAQVVRQQGADVWIALVPDLALGAASENPALAEVSCLTTRYVAEDVAVHNEDIIGGRMKELLFGLTSTLPQTLPALYRSLEIHFAAAMRCAEAGNVAGGKAHSAAVSAALGAAATYAEWAPLAPLFRSGLLDACGHFLSAAEFRAPACEVLRHVAHRRRGDVVNSVLNTSGKSKEANASSEADLAAQKEAAADAETVVVGFAAACRSLGAAAAAALAAPPADPGDEHRDYVVRLTETAAAIASNHLHVLPDAQLRVAFLEALLGLTKYPTLDTLGAAVAAWPGILRAAGAELPNGFVRPEEKTANDPKERLTLPEGAVVALLETARHWLTRGGGVAAGLSASLCPESAGDEWEQEYETRDELREVWVQHRARLMEITKLCTCLVPVAAANAAATRVAQTCALVAAGGALDPAKASRVSDASGRSALDDAAGAAFEGATSFVEPVMQALPFGDAADGSNQGTAGTANNQVMAAIAPALDAMLSNALAVSLASPVGVSQMSRLLEALGRAALARPEAGAAILNRLFEILGHLPSDDAAAPPARAKAALMAGRTAQAARQRVCAAVLGVCTAAPQVFNAHLQGFANQVESLRSSGRLSGGERGALAEALLAVAGPSGPARVREVLSWLLESVRARWVPAPGAVSPDLDALASFGELAKGEAGDGAAGLSTRHWELFHDVQLTERCLRRSGGDHDPAERAAAADAVKKTKNGVVGADVVPAGISRPVDPPPPLEECPAADHLEWVICLVEALCRATHRAWSPAHAAEASRLGLERALEMSPEENAAHLVHGPAKQFALLGGGLPPESETVSSARSWLRGLRDSAYATVALLAVHAPGAFYPSDAVAAAVSRAAHFDIASARDRHARALVHTVARPVLSRCPASHRARWHAALTTGLVPHMHERLVSAWARSRREASAAENVFGGVEDGEAAAFAASLGAGGGGAAVAELVSDRVTRDLTRDHCALLELLAAPEGTFGRKTKGSGLTGHLQNLQGGLTGAAGPTAAGETAAAERLAHGGGRHVLEWMAATRAAEGGVSGDRCARAALATAAAAVTWGDSEAAGKALGFLRGIVAAAAASGPGASMSLGGGGGFADGQNKNAPPPPPMDASLREDVAGTALSACLAGLTVPTNSAHQADVLGVIRDVVLRLLPTTRAARDTLLSLPGMTPAELDRLLSDLAQIRSEKKAATRVKETLVAAAGGGDALRAFAEARASSSSTGAIQMPSVTTRTPAAASHTWSEEDVNGIGLNPLTANARTTQ